MSGEAGEEQTLIDSARRGDNAAFEALIRAHGPQLLRLAYGILGDREAAEDAVQDALVHAWTGLSNFRGDAALSTWLHTITVRTCRRQAARTNRGEPWELARHAEGLWADADYSVDPVAVLARSAQREELRTALDALPEPYRIAVLLHDVEGLSAARVAVITRSPLGTAKARIRRGRAALVTALAQAPLRHPDRDAPDRSSPRATKAQTP
jgi:RNA polymerase sigma-70 factor (ECF subfamily)